MFFRQSTFAVTNLILMLNDLTLKQHYAYKNPLEHTINFFRAFEQTFNIRIPVASNARVKKLAFQEQRLYSVHIKL